MPFLTEIQRIPTTGARAVEPFALNGGDQMLAIPQLAADQPGTPDGINGGTSDTRVALYRDSPVGFVEAGFLPVGGGEDVEGFEVDGRRLLAVASIRSGSGPYNFQTTSPIFEETAGGFRVVQEIPTIAAKQWRAFQIGAESFLALAQGHPAAGGTSTIFRWTGDSFEAIQQLESAAGYNVATFQIEGITYLAHADHVAPAVLYRYEGDRFSKVQDLLPSGGRAFQLVEDEGELYLYIARIDGDSLVMRWDGAQFVDPQPLPGGPGGREFALLRTSSATYLVRVDFIHGTPADPSPDLLSHLYRIESGAVTTVEQFRTSGGTDVAVLPGGSGIRLAVSNGLAAQPRPGHTFAAETVIYRFDDEES